MEVHQLASDLGKDPASPFPNALLLEGSPSLEGGGVPVL